MSAAGYIRAGALRGTTFSRYNIVMRRPSTLALFIVVATLVGGIAQARAPAPLPPQALYGELYQRVQSEKLFADSKTFADATPKREPAQILQDYEKSKAAPGFSLLDFVNANFTIPGAAQSDFRTLDHEEIRAHIERLWGALTREPRAAAAPDSLLPLRTRYVVPGGRFREMYYWDSYFTMVGLQAGGHHDLVAAMVANFAGLIDDYGHIPNGNRSYYLSRSQPPFFAAMVELQAEHDGVAALAKRLPQLEAEHEFWMEGAANLAKGAAHRRVVRLADGSLLNRYWDDSDTPRDESYQEDVATARGANRPAADVYRDLRASAESGWDFSSRWFADGKKLVTIRTMEILPIDLNSLLWKLETVIARGCEIQRRADCKKDMTAQASARKRAIVRLMWDEDLGAFLDYDWKNGRRNARINAATAYPLFVDLADANQVRRAAKAIRTSLLEPHGLATTTESTGEQWDSPNGWAPLQWIAIDGLRRHGQDELAQEIAKRWIAENARVYCKTGKLVEKYDVRRAGEGMGGEYPVQDGFGWTNAVLIKLFTIYPALAAPKYEFTGAECPAP
jgi:alpha,alpha-trehalase